MFEVWSVEYHACVSKVYMCVALARTIPSFIERRKKKGPRTLRVSTGVRVILKHAAARLAKIVFAHAGRPLMYLFEVRRAKIPALAAVSPNRATGPAR